MSASREKAKRRELREDGKSKKQLAKEMSYKVKRRAKRAKNVVAAGLVVALLLVVVFTSNILYTNNTAVIVGDSKYTAADFNFYYYNAYQNIYSSLYSNYGTYISMFIDTGKPLGKQAFYGGTEGQTWADYVREQALSNLHSVHTLYQESVKAGFTLTDDEKAELDSYGSALASVAKNSDLSVDRYLSGIYGKGMNRETYLKNMKMAYTADKYSTSVAADFTYGQSDLESYYEANKNSFDTVDYRAYYIGGQADADAGIDSETAMANAKKNADQMASSARTSEAFSDLAYQYAAEDSKDQYEDADATLSRYTTYSGASSLYKDWLFDGARVYGDTTVVEDVSGSGYYVVMFESRDDINYNTASVRHVLIKPQTDEDTGAATDETWAQAKTAIEDLYTQWKEGDATEGSFAQLAEDNSEDTGSSYNGGLYENVYKGQMVTTFNDWVFDAARKPGDTGIIKSSYGYHLIYFVSEGENYRQTSVDADKRSADYTSWLDDKEKGYELDTRRFGLFFTGGINLTQ